METSAIYYTLIHKDNEQRFINNPDQFTYDYTLLTEFISSCIGFGEQLGTSFNKFATYQVVNGKIKIVEILPIDKFICLL